MAESYTRVVANGILGDLSDPYEIFSFSFAVDDGGTPLPDNFMEDIADAVEAFFGATGTRITNRATLQTVKFHHLDNTWHQDLPTVIKTRVQAGQSAASQRPSQIALAVSLRGPAAVHPARGRFYLPMPDHTLDTSSGLLDGTEIQTTANLAEQLRQDIAAAGGGGVHMSIASKGVVLHVEEVRVGRVLDTIRSRRNDVLESYRIGV